MRRRDKSQSSPGFLLIEAAITVAIVAVALVFLTRAFGTGVRAMEQARRYEAVLAVAEATLAELEAQGDLNGRLPDERDGEVTAGSQPLRWRLEHDPFEPPHEVLADQPDQGLERLVLTIAEDRDAAAVHITLTTLVPRAWLQPRSVE
jgi:type II secretory pathway pseudopilin PulG